MQCPICENKSSWENVDKYRDDDDAKTIEEVVQDDGTVKKVEKPRNMSLCKVCGFVGYPDRQEDEEKLKAYYKSQYRQHKPPTHNNIITGQRKVFYHENFLKETFAKWKKEGKTKPVISEVGAAFGMALNFFKHEFPEGDISGTEWTLKYRRVAWYEYGIKLTEDFDASKSYDMIMSYKVLEHQVKPEEKLMEYANCLKEDGLLYISVPTWFNKASNFGTSGFDLKYYYHPDHINVWTPVLFETLLKRCGLKIVKADHFMYGDTYLCKVDRSVQDEAPQYEDPKMILEAMGKLKSLAEHLKKGQPGKALKEYSNCPVAWAMYYEKNRKSIHEKHDGDFSKIYEEVCEPFLKHTKGSLESMIFTVDLMMRYDQYEQAAEIANDILDKCPNHGQALHMLSHCLRNLAKRESDAERSLQLRANSFKVTDHWSKIDVQKMMEALDWKLFDASELIAPFEIEENKQTKQGVQ